MARYQVGDFVGSLSSTSINRVLSRALITPAAVVRCKSRAENSGVDYECPVSRDLCAHRSLVP